MAETGGASLVTRFEARAPRLFLRRQMALAALAGAIAGLGQAPFNLWPLALVGLAGLFALYRIAATPLRAAWLGWAGGAGYFAVVLHWIVEPFFVDIARDGWMAPFALIFMAGGLALFWAGGFALARWLDGRALTWIVALTGVEMLRSYVLTGFPWGLIGYLWAASPAAQYGAFIGPHGLSAVALAVAVTLWRLAGPAWRKSLIMPVVYGVALGGGAWLAARAPEVPEGAPVVRMIQPNAPQREKWDPARVRVFFRRQLDFTAAAPAPGARAPDLIVWSETAIPWLLENAETPLEMITEAAGGTPVVLGLRRLDGMRLFNSLVVLDPGGVVSAIYDKYHLVPFGEYMPLGDLAARIGVHGLAAGEGNGFSAGPGPRLITLPGIGTALPLICYEAVFPQDVAAAPARPRLLLQITNDAWFGQFSGPFQHLQQARMRAIEQGLPLLRVANTGVSAMIGSRGAVLSQIPLGRAGFTDTALPPALPATAYARTGDWPALALVLAGLALAAARRRKAAGF